jgi:hypothetical protein
MSSVLLGSFLLPYSLFFLSVVDGVQLPFQLKSRGNVFNEEKPVVY